MPIAYILCTLRVWAEEGRRWELNNELELGLAMAALVRRSCTCKLWGDPGGSEGAGAARCAMEEFTMAWRGAFGG